MLVNRYLTILDPGEPHPTASTCKLVAELKPGVLWDGVAGGDTVALEVLLHVPALGLVEAVEQQRILLDVCLQVEAGIESLGLADDQRADEA